MLGSVRLRQLVAFLCGFLICLIVNRVILFTNSSTSQPRFDQIASNTGESLSLLPLMHDEESGHHGGEAVVAEEMRKKIRLFAFIVTTSKYAKQKSAYIKATWARRIERFLFLSNEDHSSLPAIKIVGEDKEQTSFQKVLAGLLFAYRHNLTYFDYFIKTEDDAYVVPENLRFLLRSFDSNDPLMMGHSNEAKADVSDRVAYVLSRGAVTAVAKGFINNVPACRNSKLREDVAMATCAHSVGVRFIPSMDDHGKQCFHSVAPSVLANYMASQTSMWIPRRTATGIATAPNWFSDHSALFHRVPEEEMYVLEYLIYHLYPYGVFRDPGIYGRALRLLSVALPKNVLTR